MAHNLHDDPAQGRFELVENGHLAFAEYVRGPSTLLIFWVEAARPLRGKGAAGRLMQGIAELAIREGRKIEPRCGYAAAWLRRHREYRHLVS